MLCVGTLRCGANVSRVVNRTRPPPPPHPLGVLSPLDPLLPEIDPRASITSVGTTRFGEQRSVPHGLNASPARWWYCRLIVSPSRAPWAIRL